jgi:glycerate kinase
MAKPMVITRKLAHKVQNDLTGIMGYIEIAIQKVESDNLKECVKMLEKAKVLIHTLSNMLNNRIKEDEEVKEKNK